MYLSGCGAGKPPSATPWPSRSGGAQPDPDQVPGVLAHEAGGGILGGGWIDLSTDCHQEGR